MTKAFGISVASKPEPSKNSRSLPMLKSADRIFKLQRLAQFPSDTFHGLARPSCNRQVTFGHSRYWPARHGAPWRCLHGLTARAGTKGRD